MLRELAQDTGLVAAVTAALADTYAGPWLHAPGQVFADLAVAIADGADCISQVEVLGDRQELAGAVASMPTTWRLLGSDRHRASAAGALGAGRRPGCRVGGRRGAGPVWAGGHRL
jgi:hypothetical protein